MLARLDEKFPEAEMLNKKQAAAFLGLSINTLNKYYGKSFGKHNYISKAQLASLLS